ncbi:MAG TPA: DUF4942 domain-containing protein, partial [Anaerolineales bacterium]|nr:DUF4942 domain-containing protein [Anaerolineales bacterium]
MFNRNFYPTPPEVIEQMLEGLSLDGKTVWEPSAGKGDIVRALQARGAQVIASEIEPELRKIVQTYCPIIAPDMMTVTSDQVSHVDYIVMNPPFNVGVEHILHAYNIAPAGCKIVALCNLASLENKYSRTRQELATIIDAYGTSQDLGDCFSQAERKTDVHVGLINIDKPGEQSKEFEGFFMGEDNEPQFNGIMPYNEIRDLVNRYCGAVRIFDEQLKTAERLNDLCEGYFGAREIGLMVTKENAPLERGRFKKDMQKAGWRWVFSKLNMEKHTTRGLRNDINKFVETQEQVPFTMRNIYRMLEIVFATTSQRMDKAAIEAFDRVTMHHHDNRYNVEGWKTNGHYLLTRRFILPGIVEHNFSGGMRTSSWDTTTVDDLTKALCFQTGRNFDEIGTIWKRFSGSENQCTFGEWYEWGFFKVKGYKKGTMHFEFLSEDVWA